MSRPSDMSASASSSSSDGVGDAESPIADPDFEMDAPFGDLDSATQRRLAETNPERHPLITAFFGNQVPESIPSSTDLHKNKAYSGFEAQKWHKVKKTMSQKFFDWITNPVRWQRVFKLAIVWTIAMIFALGEFYVNDTKVYIPVFVSILTLFLPPQYGSFFYVFCMVHGIISAMALTTLFIILGIATGSVTVLYVVEISVIFLLILGTFRLAPIQRMLSVMLPIAFTHQFITELRNIVIDGRFFDVPAEFVLNDNVLTGYCNPAAFEANLQSGTYDGLANGWICQPQVLAGLQGISQRYCSAWPADFVSNSWSSQLYDASTLNDFMAEREICVYVSEKPWEPKTVAISADTGLWMVRLFWNYRSSLQFGFFIQGLETVALIFLLASLYLLLPPTYTALDGFLELVAGDLVHVRNSMLHLIFGEEVHSIGSREYKNWLSIYRGGGYLDQLFMNRGILEFELHPPEVKKACNELMAARRFVMQATHFAAIQKSLLTYTVYEGIKILPDEYNVGMLDQVNEMTKELECHLQEFFPALSYALVSFPPPILGALPISMLKWRVIRLKDAMDRFKLNVLKNTGSKIHLGHPHLCSYFGLCVGILCMAENAIHLAEVICTIPGMRVKPKPGVLSRSLWGTVKHWGSTYLMFWKFNISLLFQWKFDHAEWHSDEYHDAWYVNPILWGQLQLFIGICGAAAVAWFCAPLNNLLLYSEGFVQTGRVGGWILFPAAFISNVSFEGTLRKGLYRAVGTAAAFVFGVAAAYALTYDRYLYGFSLTILMLLVASIGITSRRSFSPYGIFSVSYGYAYIVCIFTTYIIAFKGTDTGGAWRAPTARLISQCIGVLFGWIAAGIIFPVRGYKWARHYLGRAFLVMAEEVRRRGDFMSHQNLHDDWQCMDNASKEFGFDDNDQNVADLNEMAEREQSMIASEHSTSPLVGVKSRESPAVHVMYTPEKRSEENVMSPIGPKQKMGKEIVDRKLCRPPFAVPQYPLDKGTGTPRQSRLVDDPADCRDGAPVRSSAGKQLNRLSVGDLHAHRSDSRFLNINSQCSTGGSVVLINQPHPLQIHTQVLGVGVQINTEIGVCKNRNPYQIFPGPDSKIGAADANLTAARAMYNSTLITAHPHWSSHGLPGDNLLAMRLFHELWLASTIKEGNWHCLFHAAGLGDMFEPVRQSCQRVNMATADLIDCVGLVAGHDILCDPDTLAKGGKFKMDEGCNTKIHSVECLEKCFRTLEHALALRIDFIQAAPGFAEERYAFALWSTFLSARIGTLSYLMTSIQKPMFPEGSLQRAFKLQVQANALCKNSKDKVHDGTY